MIDNVTLVKHCKMPKILSCAKGDRVEYRGLIFDTQADGKGDNRFVGKLKNLRLYCYPDRIVIRNSIHKYIHGHNFTDFNLSDKLRAVEMLSDQTGFDLSDAVVRSMEYGCNIEENASKSYGALKCYMNKDYVPMHKNGKIYGASCNFTEYAIKAYDKALEMKLRNGMNLQKPIFRWEIARGKIRGVEKLLQVECLTLDHLCCRRTWRMLANDAIGKYDNSIKMQKINYDKIKTIEDFKIFSVMRNPEARQHIERHHRHSLKKYRSTFKRIMANREICEADCISEELRAKLELLINC